MSKSELFDFAGKKIGETNAAIRVDDGTKKVWFPKSQIEENGDGTFTIPEWLAIEKELV